MRTVIALLAITLLGCGGGSAQTPADSALTKALLERVRLDQAIRDTLVARMQSGASFDSTLTARMAAIDSANTTWLKGVVEHRGWPCRSMVGKEASEAAFLIVQHAVQDSAFQATALALMEKGVAAGEVPGSQVAMLADRVAVHRGQPQKYGTQARIENGRIVMEPIADSEHVDQRRAALGLPPLRVYVRVLDSIYTPQPKSH